MDDEKKKKNEPCSWTTDLIGNLTASSIGNHRNIVRSRYGTLLVILRQSPSLIDRIDRLTISDMLSRIAEPSLSTVISNIVVFLLENDCGNERRRRDWWSMIVDALQSDDEATRSAVKQVNIMVGFELN